MLATKRDMLQNIQEQVLGLSLYQVFATIQKVISQVKVIIWLNH